jgi:hypothetical protein
LFGKGFTMKARVRLVLCCLIAVCLPAGAGCRKKAEPPKTAPATPAKTAAPAPGSTTAAPTVDTATPIAEVQTQAQAMSIETLKATALQYKQAILDKQAQLEQVVAKVKQLPVTEALGKEAQTLKLDLQNLQTSVGALKERFQVYYSTLKQKGADLTGLAL